MSLTEQKIIKLSEKEHILRRSSMYLGSSTLTELSEYILQDNKFIKTTLAYVPGLVKIFNELIDNSIDEYVRTKGQFADKIEVKIDNKTFFVKDNGRGIPITKVETPEGEIFQPELAWTHARAGSNFENDNTSTIGTNGVGSMIASVFSKEFTGISDDGKNKCVVKCKNNNDSIETKILKTSGSTGVQVTMTPDIERFGLEEITQPHIKMIEQRLYNLSVSYPDITFKLNGKRIKLNNKKFLDMFGEEPTIYENVNYSIGVYHSDTDDFKHFSLMNGLILSAGGTHLDYITNGIVKVLRDKISKKYKTIKPNDVKRKLFIVVVMKNFKGPKYETQTKEKLTNSLKDIQEYFKDLDLEKFANKIYTNKSITNSIIDYFRIAEEYKKQKELKGLEKPRKKIRSDKYTKPVGEKNILFICEGESALGGLIPAVGRKGIGFYVLKGKPLNTWDVPQSKFTNNKELTELYQIIKQENYNKIVYATDQDLDGYHIRILLTGFVLKYLSDYKDRIGMLQTPVLGVKKNKKLIRWYYSLHDNIELKKGEVSKYYKGLGSHKKEDLSHIIKTDGIDKMIDMIEWDNEAIVEEWLSKDKIQERKNAISNNEFDIAKL